MEENVSVIRSVSLPLMVFRVAQKYKISPSKALKIGIAVYLEMAQRNGAELTEYESYLISDSPLGELKRSIAEKVLNNLRGV